MRIAKLKKDKILLTFPYEAGLVALIGNVPGRTYSKKTHIWQIPIAQTEALLKVIRPLGFEIEPAILKEEQRQIRTRHAAARLKEGTFKDSEIALFNTLEMPLYTYQKIGAGFMCATGGALLGDQPGLGKTIQSLGSTVLNDSKKVLIFCPVSMKLSWQEEIEKWIPGATSIVIGGDKTKREEQWSNDVQYYICNYHLLLRDMKFMQAINWDAIIGDEATCISNPQSKTTKELKKIKAIRKFALTGTPLNNSVQDVWSIMDWVQPGLLGSFYQFQEEYTIKDRFGSVNAYKNLRKLNEKLDTFMLRRLKSDVLTELPPKLHEPIYVEFSAKETQMYQAIQAEIIVTLKAEGMFNDKNLSKALVKMIRLKQMTSSMELINGEKTSAKLTALKEILPFIVGSGEKAIIFSTLREMAVILMEELKEYKPLLIAGGVSHEDRDKNRKLFNADDEHKLLIMTSAGSMGLNLQRASSVIHYDLPWSISQLEQREDRAHRNGQKNVVTVYTLLAKDTIDEYILKVLFKKKEVSEVVLGDNKVVKLPKLTKTDISNLLT